MWTKRFLGGADICWYKERGQVREVVASIAEGWRVFGLGCAGSREGVERTPGWGRSRARTQEGAAGDPCPAWTPARWRFSLRAHSVPPDTVGGAPRKPGFGIRNIPVSQAALGAHVAKGTARSGLEKRILGPQASGVGDLCLTIPQVSYAFSPGSTGGDHLGEMSHPRASCRQEPADALNERGCWCLSQTSGP